MMKCTSSVYKRTGPYVELGPLWADVGYVVVYPLDEDPGPEAEARAAEVEALREQLEEAETAAHVYCDAASEQEMQAAYAQDQLAEAEGRIYRDVAKLLHVESGSPEEVRHQLQVLVGAVEMARVLDEEVEAKALRERLVNDALLTRLAAVQEFIAVWDDPILSGPNKWHAQKRLGRLLGIEDMEIYTDGCDWAIDRWRVERAALEEARDEE